MSRSQHEADLCALLVNDVYGELSSRIFTVLLQRGRLTTSSLAQQTGLRPSLLKQGLVVLIQHNLIYYHHNPLTNVTFYEANWDAAYVLARAGRIGDVVEARFGGEARDVVQNILSLGHAKIEDLAESYTKAPPKANGDTNEVGEDVEMTNGGLTHGQLDNILYQLLQCGYLQPLSAPMFKSPADIYDEVEQEILKGADGGAKGSKKHEELKGKIRSNLQELRDKTTKWQPVNTGNKRSRDNSESYGPEKRRKLANGVSVNGTSHGSGSENIKLDVNMVVRVNHEKLAVALRNQHLVELAEHYIGVTTAFVYSQLLALMENQIPRCRRDPIIDDLDETDESPAIPTIEIMALLPKSIDMSQGIGKPPKDKHKAEADSDDDVDMNGNIPEVDQDSESEDDAFRLPTPGKSNKVTFENKKPVAPADKRTRMEQVRQHLLLLATDNRRFVRQVGGPGGNSWAVDFTHLGEFLRNHELDTVIFAKFQEKGIRLVRILREKGKLEEKQLCNLALMKQKDARTLLVEMQMAGYLDVQEVPKDNQRIPQKTIFLWWFDTERVMQLVTSGIYKAMSRSLQRLDVERYRDKVHIEMSERTDVNGDLEMLSADTVANLKRFRKKEELLSGLMSKLDRTAAVFRDY